MQLEIIRKLQGTLTGVYRSDRSLSRHKTLSGLQGLVTLFLKNEQQWIIHFQYNVIPQYANIFLRLQVLLYDTTLPAWVRSELYPFYDALFQEIRQSDTTEALNLATTIGDTLFAENIPVRDLEPRQQRLMQYSAQVKQWDSAATTLAAVHNEQVLYINPEQREQLKIRAADGATTPITFEKPICDLAVVTNYALIVREGYFVDRLRLEDNKVEPNILQTHKIKRPRIFSNQQHVFAIACGKIVSFFHDNEFYNIGDRNYIATESDIKNIFISPARTDGDTDVLLLCVNNHLYRFKLTAARQVTYRKDVVFSRPEFNYLANICWLIDANQFLTICFDDQNNLSIKLNKLDDFSFHQTVKFDHAQLFPKEKFYYSATKAESLILTAVDETNINAIARINERNLNEQALVMFKCEFNITTMTLSRKDTVEKAWFMPPLLTCQFFDGGKKIVIATQKRISVCDLTADKVTYVPIYPGEVK